MAGRESTKVAVTEVLEEPATLPQEDELGLGPSQWEVAEYVAQMAVGMRVLARQEELSFLAYLLGLVLEESRRVAGSRQTGETHPGG